MEKGNLFIIDGHALAYRAYYAMFRNPLTNSKGEPTSAIYGLANYIFRLLKRPECSHFVVVFDPKGPSFRRDIYNEYKANRSAMPDDMISQMPLLFDLVKALNIPCYVQQGFEADDVIAYLSRKAENDGYKVSLITKDKDLMQLISENIRMLSPESGGKFSEFGPKEVEKKMGVAPNRILDLLALMGDSADNIPGLPGVGPKTAIKILEKVESINQLLADPSLVDNKKLQTKIEENSELLKLSKVLVTLEFDVGLDVDIEELRVVPPNKKACIEFFREMEFDSLLRDPIFDVRETAEFEINTVQSIEELNDIITLFHTEKEFCIDTETTSLDTHTANLVGISLAINRNEGWYIPLGHSKGNNVDIDNVLSIIKPLLEDASIGKIGQNLKYDYQIFKQYGITLAGICFDTMIAAYLINPSASRFGMDSLASSWLDIKTVSIEELIGKGKSQILFSEVPIEKAAPYAIEDVVIPLRLKEKLEPILAERNLDSLFRDIEIPLVTVLAEMEWAGIAVDLPLLESLSETYGENLKSVSAKIFEIIGEEINLNSPKQVGEMLFGKMTIPGGKKTKTGYSTDVKVLQGLATNYPIAKLMLEYREVQKLLSTYIDALPQAVNGKTGRIHTSFKQTGTATGRLSSTNPNLQNVPIRTDAGRKIREAFIAKPGNVIISADYSQIELRILAHLSDDYRLITAFNEDLDIHTQTASAMYNIFPEMVTSEMRRAAKTINFGLMYGMGPHKLAGELSISFKEAKEFIDTYFEQFPTIRSFMENCVKNARENGYTETLLGRKRYLPEIDSSNVRIREGAERIAVNTPVQGTAADIMKIAMVNISQNISVEFPTADMLLQVHDELIFEVEVGSAKPLLDWVVEKMSSAFTLSAPLKVEASMGDNWEVAH